MLDAWWSRRQRAHAFIGDLALIKPCQPGPVDSPADCLAHKKENQIGNPDPKHNSTGYLERANFTMRMSRRRFTRLTNGFSRKVENHAAALPFYFMYCSFGRKHQTLTNEPYSSDIMSLTQCRERPENRANSFLPAIVSVMRFPAQAE